MEINKQKMDSFYTDLSDYELIKFKQDSYRRVDIFGNKVYTHYSEELLPIYKKFGKWNGKCWIVENVEEMIEELAQAEEGQRLNITYYYKKDDHE